MTPCPAPPESLPPRLSGPRADSRESRTDRPRISVIVPTLDEEHGILACLASVGETPEVEVVVSDGGSSDRTLELVREGRPEAVVIAGPSGRGGQLNRGAAAASAARLLFLHADCVLPVGWFETVMDALDEPSTVLACFRLHTRPVDGRRPGWRRRLWLGIFDLRSRGWGLPYGDQGFALRRDAFDALGGFPEIPLMEDLALARTARRVGRIRRLPLAIETTARRVEGNPLRAQLVYAAFPTLFRLGVPPETLARWYGVVR
jgi:rSAM/selenodomain-associated transferase 2